MPRDSITMMVTPAATGATAVALGRRGVLFYPKMKHIRLAATLAARVFSVKMPSHPHEGEGEFGMGLFDRFRKQPEAPAQSGTASESPARPQSPGPGRFAELPVEELKKRLDAGEAPLLIDVREPWEYQIVSLPGATLMPMNTIPARMKELDRDAEIIVYCHHGSRSWNVAGYLAQNGFTRVQNLTGGIDSWARRVDPAMRKY